MLTRKRKQQQEFEQLEKEQANERALKKIRSRPLDFVSFWKSTVTDPITDEELGTIPNRELVYDYITVKSIIEVVTDEIKRVKFPLDIDTPCLHELFRVDKKIGVFSKNVIDLISLWNYHRGVVTDSGEPLMGKQVIKDWDESSPYEIDNMRLPNTIITVVDPNTSSKDGSSEMTAKSLIIHQGAVVVRFYFYCSIFTRNSRRARDWLAAMAC